jgi:hypothetical protein
MLAAKKKTAAKASEKRLPPPYKYIVTTIPDKDMWKYAEKIAEANKILQNTKFHDPDWFFK